MNEEIGDRFFEINFVFFKDEKVSLMMNGKQGSLVFECSEKNHDAFVAQLCCMFSKESELDQELANKKTLPICCP